MQEAKPPEVLKAAGRMGLPPFRAAASLLRNHGPAPPLLRGSRRSQMRPVGRGGKQGLPCTYRHQPRPLSSTKQNTLITKQNPRSL
ncbi:hypothetical protein D623_10011188 [Myotis brandtii]|uniref:Uncharacterized protein n=1 Tax=Myotis brandtii TaxID=109478 RepID=S7NEK2_MYOBR|nr:hypothetical protein D623_10011188 [Myotis brandtii]